MREDVVFGPVSSKFPADKILRQKWILATRRKNWIPGKQSCLCSKHFLPQNYQKGDGSQRHLLIPDTVPCVFDYTGDGLKTFYKTIVLKPELFLPNTISPEHQQQECTKTFIKVENNDFQNYDAEETNVVEDKISLKVENVISLKNKLHVNNKEKPELNLPDLVEKDHSNVQEAETENLDNGSCSESQCFMSEENVKNFHSYSRYSIHPQESLYLEELEKELLSDKEEEDEDSNDGLPVPINIVSLQNQTAVSNCVNNKLPRSMKTIPLRRHLEKMSEAKKKIRSLERMLRKRNVQIHKLKERVGILTQLYKVYKNNWT